MNDQAAAATAAFYGRTMCERRARQALDAVGDAHLGEWLEWSGAAFHLRRRLTAAEQRHVGPVVDIRGTPEAQRRAAALPSRLLRFVPDFVLAEEIGTTT